MRLHGAVSPADWADWYAVPVREGDELRLTSLGAACVGLALPGETPGQICFPPQPDITRRATTAGTAIVSFSVAGAYSFAVDVGRAPPGPVPAAHDDAGSGRDAGHTHASALPIPPGFRMQGRVAAPADTWDWYAVPVRAGDDIHLTSLGAACVGLALPGETPGQICFPPQYDISRRATTDGIAIASFGVAGAYTFRVDVGEPSPPLVAAAAEDDAASGADAPSSDQGGLPVAPGTYRGALLPPDVEDAFSFHVEAGQRIRLSTTAAGTVGLVRPDGSRTSPSWNFVPGAGGSLIADMGGTWRLAFFGAGPYEFTLGLEDAVPGPATPEGEHVVVAVIDTGINPYHRDFLAPALSAHPSTWLAGFPEDVPSVALSLDAGSHEEARERDAALWRAIPKSAVSSSGEVKARPVTFPGTRVVAGLSFGEYAPSATALPLLDDHGHGTHSASLALGADVDAPQGNVLLVAIETSGAELEAALRWVAQQPWIDAVSVSWGGAGNLPTSFGTGPGSMEQTTRAVVESGKPVFWASNNGFTNTALAPDQCLTYTNGDIGAPWVTRIGAAAPSNGNPTYWHCRPVEAVARTEVPAARHDAVGGHVPAGGTSAASPNAAGHFAHLLLAARTAGVDASRHDALQHLLNASEPAQPGLAARAQPSLGATAWHDQGFGLVDGRALDRAKETLLAGAPPRPRPELDGPRAADQALRHALWGDSPRFVPLPGLPVQLPDARPLLDAVQDDAGSGGDAPDEPMGLRIAMGQRVRGTILGTFQTASLDRLDLYAFDAEEGETLTLSSAFPGACFAIIPPGGGWTGTYSCASAYMPQALDATGTWHVGVTGLTPVAYEFTLALTRA